MVNENLAGADWGLWQSRPQGASLTSWYPIPSNNDPKPSGSLFWAGCRPQSLALK